MKGLFITATGTEMGKTYISAHLLKQLYADHLCAGYYKAAASDAHFIDGAWVADDLAYVRKISHANAHHSKISYVYHHALSPHLAAQIERKPLQIEKVYEDLRIMQELHEFLLVEGSGGLICPLRWDEQQYLLSDLIKQSGFPLLIVADAGLGTINTCVLTAAYADQHQLPVYGFVLNHYDADNEMHQDNRKMIEALSGYPVIACVQDHQQKILNDEQLKKLILL